jgi:hypothetical protein
MREPLVNDASVDRESDPATDLELDLSQELPTESRCGHAPIERVRPDELRVCLVVGDARGEIYVGVKGAFHRAAEYLVLCTGSALIALAGAGSCRIAGAPAWLSAAAGLALGAAALYIGYQYLTLPGRQVRHVTKEK